MVLLLPAWAALLVSEEIAGPFVLVLGWSPASGARGRPLRLQEREGSSDWKPRVRGRGLSLEGPGGEPRQEPGRSFLCRRASSGLLGPSPGVGWLRCGGPGSGWGVFRVGRLGSNPVVFIPRSDVFECKCSMLW